MAPAILIILAVGLLVVFLILKRAMKSPQTRPEALLCDAVNLQGELVSIEEDVSGLSRVTVKGSKGKILYGFSTLPVSQLETLYGGKGWIQIPLVTPPAGRAYQVDDTKE